MSSKLLVANVVTFWCVLLSGTALMLAVVGARSEAFDSYGVAGVTGGAIHGEITEDATKRLSEQCRRSSPPERPSDCEQVPKKAPLITLSAGRRFI
jgi:hypothetical protein